MVVDLEVTPSAYCLKVRQLLHGTQSDRLGRRRSARSSRVTHAGASVTATACSCCSSADGGSHGWRFDYRFSGKRNDALARHVPRHLAGARSPQGRRGASPARRGHRSERSAQGRAKVCERGGAGGAGTRGAGPAAGELVRGGRARVVRSASTAAGPKSYADKIIARLEDGRLPVDRSDAGQRRHAAASCSRWCAGSRPAASSRRRTGRWRTAARSFATPWRSARPRRTRRAI